MACATVLLALAPHWAVGQTVRGVVTRADGGGPLAGALVEVVGAQGSRLAGQLTGPGGEYSITTMGATTVQASFVGMETAHEVLGALAVRDTVFVDLQLESRAIELGGLSVEAEERCGGDAFQALEIGRLWREARTALESIEWATDASLFRYDVETHVRRLDPSGSRVLSESRQDLPAWGPHPFRSVDASRLARDGYVQQVDGKTMYYAPDVDALLSEAFLATHCFGVERRTGDSPGIGLSFRPVDGRNVPDILGTFWLDVETSRLLELTFRYTGLVRDIDTSHLGGRIQFGALEGGGWIVEEWDIRMPAVGLQRVAGSLDQREVVVALEEHGGEVRRVHRSGQRIWEGSDRGRIEGRIVKEGSGESAHGVEVRVAGTTYVTRSNAAGAFSLRGIPDGLYELQVHDPTWSLMGLDTVRTPVRPVSDGDGSTESAREVLIRIPTIESDTRRHCSSVATPSERLAGSVRGVVLDEGSSVPVPDAKISLSWRTVQNLDETGFDGRMEWSEVSTDGAGGFVFCDVPADVGVTVLASALGKDSAPRTIRLADGGVEVVHLSIAAGDPVSVSGRVRTTSGAALANAVVSIGDRQILSDDNGRFEIGDVPAGSYSVHVSHLGRSSSSDSVHVAGGAENFFEISMPDPALELEGLLVEVTRGARARYRARGTRVDVMTREQIEAAAFGAPSIATVLQHAQVPGLYSYETLFYVDGTKERPRPGVCIQLGRNAGAECRMPEVYLNGARLAKPHFVLLGLDVMSIDRIEILPAIEAETFYPNSRYGALLIYTR